MSEGLPTFATQTLTVLRATTTTDSHGNARPDWAHADEHEIEHCLLVPHDSVEQLGTRDEITSAWELFAPVGADVLATDRVRDADGVVYEVNGSVLRFQTGVLDHVAAVLTRIEG